jgi:hypothetical protein
MTLNRNVTVVHFIRSTYTHSLVFKPEPINDPSEPEVIPVSVALTMSITPPRWDAVPSQATSQLFYKIVELTEMEFQYMMSIWDCPMLSNCL